MKRNDKRNKTISFKMEVGEETKDFFNRMLQEEKEREEAFRERIQQLFDENIQVDGVERDAAYRQILQVFAIGYQLGWRDHYEITKTIELC